MYRSYSSYAAQVQKHHGKFIGWRDVSLVLNSCSRSVVKDQMLGKLNTMLALVTALSQRTKMTLQDVKYGVSINREHTRARLYMLPRDSDFAAVAVAELRLAEDVLQEWLHLYASSDVHHELFKLAAEML